MQDFLNEIKRRNVFRVAFVYIVAGWLTMQVVDIMFPALQLPEWMISAVAALILIGLPFALIFAWAFEMTPDGLKREKEIDRSQSITPQTGKKLNRTALIILTIAVGLLLIDKFVLQDEGAPRQAAADIKPSIAVLPFVNMSDDRDNEYFSDGLAEELLNLLAKIPQLHVAGRTSSFKFKDTNEDLRVIGQALNVAHVLEGSVRKSGPRLRITAQLIDTENGYHLWSETYDRDLTDIFAIQDEIAGHVVEALRAHLLGAEVAVANQGTTNVEAYNQLLRGRYFLEHTSTENLQKALAAYEKAIELDPGFARAYAGLVVTQQQLFGGWTESSGGNFIQTFAAMKDNADKAIALDPDSADSLIAQAIVASAFDWNMPRAREYTLQALAVGANDPLTLGWHASVLTFLAEFDEAESLLLRAIEIDPLSITNYRALGDLYMVTGRCDTAIRTYQRALDVSPDAGRLNGRMARCSMFQDEIVAARTYNAREPVTWVRETNDLIIRGREQQDDAWHAAIADYEQRYGFGNSYQMAEIYADAGDLDMTFEWLAHTVRVKDPGGPWALIMPFFEEARKDPRWAQFRAAFGL